MKNNGVSDLISQYKSEYRNIQELKKQANPSDIETVRVLNGMARDIRIAIDLMETGYYHKTGEILVGGSAEIDRLSIQQRIWEYGYQELQEEQQETDEKNGVHYDFKSILSNREYLCLLAYERGLSIRKIAEYLEVAASTVQCYVERARKKLEANEGTIQMSLWDNATDIGA